MNSVVILGGGTAEWMTELFHQNGCFQTMEQDVYTKTNWIHFMFGFEVMSLYAEPQLNSINKQQVADFFEQALKQNKGER